MGSVERCHRQIVEMGLGLLSHSNLPKPYYEDVFLMATYIINRLPTKILNNHSPHEVAYNEKNQITISFACLDVHVGQIYEHITNIKLILDPNFVFLLVIVSHIKDTNVIFIHKKNICFAECHI